MHIIVRRYRARLSWAKAIKLKKIWSTSSLMGWKYSLFIARIKAEVNFAATLILNYRLEFVNTSIEGIVDNAMYNVARIPAVKDGSNIRSVHWVARLFLKNEALFFLLQVLSDNEASRKNLWIFHDCSSFLYSSNSDEVELTVEVANYFIKNATKSTTFYAAPFYNTCQHYLPWRSNKLSTKQELNLPPASYGCDATGPVWFILIGQTVVFE